jgi:hypothetical protein
VNLAHPANTKVLACLARGGSGSPVFSAWDSVAAPSYLCGRHPEIVERLWEQLGAALASDCRCLVHLIPALVQPRSGVILGIGLGTQWGVRVPGALVSAAIAAGAKTQTKWSGGKSMDIQPDLGEDGVFGRWRVDRVAWCRSLYDRFHSAADSV